MSNHTVTLDFGTGTDFPAKRFHCSAPAGSLCHAYYECSCEVWSDEGIVHGKPFHRDSGDVIHFGHWRNDECRLEDWFDGCDEVMRGEVTIPVRPSWDGDYYQFDVTPESTELGVAARAVL